MPHAETHSVITPEQNLLEVSATRDRTSLLCLPAQQNAPMDAAILRIATDFAHPASLPVLLLDLGLPANRFFRQLARSGRLEPRPSPTPAPPHQAVLHFHRLRDANVMVSQIAPDPSQFDDAAWDLRHSGALERLKALFSRVVIAPPPLDRTAAIQALAGSADATLLLLRRHQTPAAEATALRDQVIACGGWPVGGVLVS